MKLDEDSHQFSSRRSRTLRVIGYLDTTGNIQPITPDDLIKIFDRNLQKIGRSREINQEISNDLPAMIDIESQNESDEQTLPAIDLIVLDTQDNRPYLVPNVRFSTVFLDALNAALVRNISVNSYDLKTLDIDQVVRLPITGGQEI